MERVAITATRDHHWCIDEQIGMKVAEKIYSLTHRRNATEILNFVVASGTWILSGIILRYSPKRAARFEGGQLKTDVWPSPGLAVIHWWALFVRYPGYWSDIHLCATIDFPRQLHTLHTLSHLYMTCFFHTFSEGDPQSFYGVRRAM